MPLVQSPMYPRKDNFFIEESTTGTWVLKKYINGVYDSEGGPLYLVDKVVADVKSGYNIPNFHKRRNAGELLSYTPWHMVSYEYTTSGSLWWVQKPSGADLWRWQWEPQSPSGTYFLHPSSTIGAFTYPVWGSVSQWIDDQGIDPRFFTQKAAAKLYSRGWDALTFLAEARQVLRMFKGVYQKLNSFLSQAEKARMSPDDYWLEYRYGWRILVYDIQDIWKLLSTMDEEVRLRNKERSGHNYSWVTESSAYDTGSSTNTTTSVVINHECGVRGSIIADFVPPRVQSNIVKTTWEVVPFSFVVDWFFNIGQAIDAMSFLTFTGNYAASYGLYYRHERAFDKTAVANPGWTFGGEAHCVEKVEVKLRQPCTVPYFPSFNLRLDEFKVVDLLALLLQRLLHIRR